MKCPFTKIVTITRGLGSSYSHKYDEIKQSFNTCLQNECMAYDKETKTCIKLNKGE